MNERVLGRSKRALVLFVHLAIACTLTATPLLQSNAFAQQAAPPVPVPVPAPPPSAAASAKPGTPPGANPAGNISKPAGATAAPSGGTTTPAAATTPTTSTTNTPSPVPPTASSMTAGQQVLPPAPPAGSPPPTAAQLAEAKKFFEAGLKLMKEQLYQEALASFLEAYRISARESIANNIALCYRNLKDFASAYVAYEEVLARFGDKMKAKSKDDIQRALEELAVLTGLVDVKVPDEGARVTVDGKEIGKTPLPKPIRVNIGAHAVTIAKEGFETLTKQVEIRGHDTVTVTGPLEKEVLTGHVAVTVQPPDPNARVLVDGKDVGAAPWQGDLDPGMHTIEAKGDGTAAAPKQIEVAKKGKYDVALDLKAQEGIVSVTTQVPDAEITIDGKVVGRGVWEGPVRVGRHDLGVVKVGFAPYARPLLVHEGERVVENVQLTAQGGAGVAEAPHDWTGVYTQLNFVGAFPIGAPSNDVAQGRDLASTTTIKGSGGYGGGINVRVGYSFGYIGVEGSAIAAYSHSAAEVDYASGESTAVHPGGTPRTESYDFHAFGGMLDAAVRFMPKTRLVRPTIAIGGGASIKGAIYKRDATDPSGSNSYPSDPITYVTPNFIADAGLQIGSTPGTRFYIGVLYMMEFPGGATASTSTALPNGPPAPTKPLDLANGTDIFIGPVLGLQFGE